MSMLPPAPAVTPPSPVAPKSGTSSSTSGNDNGKQFASTLDKATSRTDTSKSPQTPATSKPSDANTQDTQTKTGASDTAPKTDGDAVAADATANTVLLNTGLNTQQPTVPVATPQGDAPHGETQQSADQSDNQPVTAPTTTDQTQNTTIQTAMPIATPTPVGTTPATATTPETSNTPSTGPVGAAAPAPATAQTQPVATTPVEPQTPGGPDTTPTVETADQPLLDPTAPKEAGSTNTKDTDPALQSTKTTADTPVRPAAETVINNLQKTAEVNTPKVATQIHQTMPEPIRQVVQLVHPLRHQGDGDYKLTLQLYPEHLGRVEVAVTLNQGQISMQLSTDNQQSRQMLRDAMNDLRQALADSGLNAGSLDVSDHQFNGQQNPKETTQSGQITGTQVDMDEDTFLAGVAERVASNQVATDGAVDVRV